MRRGRSLFGLFCRKPCAPACAPAKSKTMKTEAGLIHALVVIFLEYFAWGLLTVPVINVLAETFPSNKFLMNGLILGFKGILSFLSAPLVGALSDVWGRKRFLLLTVLFTCLPIPCLKINAWWYFTLFTLSGILSVTFSVALSYVADITTKEDRATACGLVSATFAASLVTSPALGAYVSSRYSDEAVVVLATIIFLLDLIFIVVAVPESLQPKKQKREEDGAVEALSPASCTAAESFTWQTVDPFLSLRVIARDRSVLQIAAIVFLSHLPEAGQFSCFFVYLKLVVGFSPEAVALFIAFVGVLSVVAQTGVLLLINQKWGAKHSITFGLCAQFAQLTWYGLGTQTWMMWAAGVFAALSSLSYPAISAFVSVQTDRDMQGTVQGVLTGIRGLCMGFGPAVFGFIFYLFDMDLSVDKDETGHLGVGPQFPIPHIRLQPFESRVIAPNRNHTATAEVGHLASLNNLIPGPPFLFGALLVFMAMMVNLSLPASMKEYRKQLRRTSSGSAAHQRHVDTALLMGADSD
ncbi:Hippocampus abundant transcript 1 protein [Aphelenchoides fujianensis]|nr:Hippocampus abundant transcript 1 protein [Aphelenchoides fujianensis]KAI6238928.1 Hippocampus abundant transcript 1 protein [Aphelenchoides fujianensis]